METAIKKQNNWRASLYTPFEPDKKFKFEVWFVTRGGDFKTLIIEARSETEVKRYIKERFFVKTRKCQIINQ